MKSCGPTADAHAPKAAPLITIGVTCYNAEGTIRRALEGAIAQDWPKSEIVVVDDASSDGSWNVIQTFADAHATTSVFRHVRNKGYAAGLNTILSHARGEFVAFFDDDDESLPERLRSQHQRITGYESASGDVPVLCYSNRRVVTASGAGSSHISQAIGRRQVEPHGTMVADYLFGVSEPADYAWGMFGSCTLMARREVFGTVGPFDEDFRRCAEWDFAVRAAFGGAHFIAVDQPLVTQYKTVTSDKSGRTPLNYAIKLRRKHRRHLESQGLFWASMAFAHAKFHGNGGRRWKSRAYAAMARALLYPSAAAGSLGTMFRRGGADGVGRRRVGAESD